jgi:hypothetical protein
MVYEVSGPWLCETCGAIWILREQADECEAKHEEDPIPLSPPKYLRTMKEPGNAAV